MATHNATSADLPGASTTSGVYPSTKQQCHQAITAAQWAAQQGVGGTRVYAVAYGATSSGCTTDTKPNYHPMPDDAADCLQSGIFLHRLLIEFKRLRLSLSTYHEPESDLHGDRRGISRSHG